GGAAARVGARPGDVPKEAGPLPDLPVNMVLRDWLTVAAALALGLRSPSPEGRGGQGVRTADTLWLENARLRLGFDPGNGSLLALTDRASGQSFVGGRSVTAIWRLDRLGPGDSSIMPCTLIRFSMLVYPGAWPVREM